MGVWEVTIYVGDYERVIESGASNKEKTRHYIGAHTILTQAVSGASDDPAISHIARDRLGSVSLVIDGDRHIDDGHNGQELVLERRTYDAFGKAIVLPIGLLPSLFATTDRGFTDHEYLLDVELIHMNGRAFDYNLGRFLSVDPFIQGAANTQSINPYSYILNNPMSGIDPTGYSRIDRSRDLGSFIASNIDEDFASTTLAADDKLTSTVSSDGKNVSVTVSITNKDGETTKSTTITKAGSFKSAGKGATLGFSGGDQQGSGGASAGDAEGPGFFERINPFSKHNLQKKHAELTAGCQAQNYAGGCNSESVTPEMADLYSQATGGTLGAISPGQSVAFAGEQMLIRAPTVVAKSLGSFADDPKLIGHFVKHGAEFGVRTPEAYLALARQVMKNGIKVSYSYKDEVRTGFVQFMKTNKKGVTKFAFVGTNNKGYITTLHTKSGKDFWKTLNGNAQDKTIKVAQ